MYRSASPIPATARTPESEPARDDQRRLVLIGIAGVLAAAAVAYASARNPYSSPPGVLSPLTRAVDVLSIVGAGIYAMVRHPEERLGRALVILGLVSAVWFLTGARNPYLYSLAMLVGIFAVPGYNYLLLSFPEGHLHSRLERRLTFGAGAIVVIGWIPLWLISRQPAIAAPFIHCLPRCPRNVLFVGTSPGLHDLAVRLVRIGYAVLTLGVVVVLVGRLRRSSSLTRIMLGPVLIVSIAYAVILAASLLVGESPTARPTIVDWLLLAAVPAVPLALVVGLVREELFLKRALEGLVGGLSAARSPQDLRILMHDALHDESLRLVFWSERRRCFTDLGGTPARLPPDGVQLRPLDIPGPSGEEGGPAAAIVIDSALAEDPRFLRAVTAAAGMAVHRYQLEADLRRSRRRLIAAADRERERLERNLHDGVQQRLVALRVRLGLASEAIEAQSPDGAGLFDTLDQELAAAIDELREVAHGLYPHLLDRFGLPVALQAATRRSARPASVSAEHVGRYEPELELAVYFCCLEAVQNADKHAGEDARTAVRLWHQDGVLHFEVSDQGGGFTVPQDGSKIDGVLDPSATSGAGLQNMRDRIGAVGGILSIQSAAGHGTSITGAVPAELVGARFMRGTREPSGPDEPGRYSRPERAAISPGSEDALRGARP